MKDFKKILAIVLSVVILLSSLSMTFMAINENSNKNENVGISNDDVTLSGTTPVGNMIADEFENISEQNQNSGNVIFSVEVEGDSAFAEFSTAVSCLLYVGIYTEDSSKLLSSGYTAVTPQDEYVYITLENAAPEYFYVKAFLIDAEDYSPLSAMYTNALYTQEMQEFLSKTTDDFDAEKVINFDDDKINNFAVLSDDVTILEEESETNKLTFADASSQIYIIENIDENISSLKVGDTFSGTYNEEVFVVKIGEISIDGTTATILGADAELEEVFDYVKIDNEIGISENSVDETTCGEGVTFEGYEEIPTTYSSRAIDIGRPIEQSANFSFDYRMIGNDSLNIAITGEVGLNLFFSPKLYISLNYKYIELKYDYSVSGSFSITGKVEHEFPLAYFTFGIPLLRAEVVPKVVLSASGSVEISGTLLKGTVGYGWYSDVGAVNLSTTPKSEVELKIPEIIIFVGLRVDPKVKILEGALAEASIEANVGVEANVYLKANTSDLSSVSQIHSCGTCVEGGIYGKFDLSVKGELLNNKNWSLSFNVVEVKVKIFDFYWSITHGDFGLTTCPHISYKLNVVVLDRAGNPIEGAEVLLNGNSYYTSKKGTISEFLPNGSYKITVSKGELTLKEDTVNINNSSKTLNFSLQFTSSQIPPTPQTQQKLQQIDLFGFSSAVVTEMGDLYMWGWNSDGQIGNGTTANVLSPQKIMSNVASVSLGMYHSAAITKSGDLYMWGLNLHNQIDDSSSSRILKPKKIMSNVSAVSLGNIHTAVITKTGALFMWGENGHGQIGDGTTTRKSTPKMIMDNVASVSLGYWYSTAITKTGDLYMWGCNDSGQLGDGTTTDVLTPKKIMNNVALVSLGLSHSAAITKTGDLYSWGENDKGQIGDGTTTSVLIPKKIMSNVVSVSLDYYHSAAITKTGGLYSWGENNRGQIGDGTTTDVLTPKKIMSNVTSVSLGAYHSAAITQTGKLYMWGSNSYGQLGDGTTSNSYSPKLLTLPISVAEIPVFNSTSPITEVLEEKDFSNLEPNSLYNFYIMSDRNAEDVFSSGNTFYIDQAITDENGAVTFSYMNTGTSVTNAEKFVVKFRNALPDDTISETIVYASKDKVLVNVKDSSLAECGYENIKAEITLNDEIIIVSDYTANEDDLLFACDVPEESNDDMIIAVRLYADYAGVTYESKNNQCSLKEARNDLNADGSFDALDFNDLMDFSVGEKEDSDERFDLNDDSEINILDIIKIKKNLLK